jgi:MOSC domain-containing protein YiiM
VPRVVHLFRAPKRRAPMEELPSVEAVKDTGFKGCAHARPGGKRQVLVVDVESLGVFQLSPGIIRENITTEGLDVNALPLGQKLRMGAVNLEVSAVCDPCEQIEALRPGLQVELHGRRGMLCRVLTSGTLRRGDPIELL